MSEPTPTIPTEEKLSVAAGETDKFRQAMGNVSRQSGIFFAGMIFTTTAGYFFKIYLARELGAEGLGIYALGMTVLGFLNTFACLGLPQTATRFVAVYNVTENYARLRGLIGRSLLIILLTNSAFALLTPVWGPWVALQLYHTPALLPYLWMFMLLMVIGAAGTFLGLVLVGYRDVARRTIISNLIGTPAMMVLTIALLLLHRGLSGYLVAQIVSTLLTIVLLGAAVWKLTPVPARRPLTSWPRLEPAVVSFSATLFGVQVLEFVLGQTDKVLIGMYLDPSHLGIYAVAAGMVAFVPIILQSVNQIFGPTISDLHARGAHALLGKLYRSLTRWIIGLTLPLALVVIVFSAPLMRIFGREFEAGWPVLIVGTLGQLVNCGVGSVGQLLVMSGNERRFLRVQIIMAVAIVSLNFWLIPRWGIVGAALAAAASNVGTNVLMLREVRRGLGLWPYDRSYFLLVLPTIMTAAAIGAVRLFVLGPDWLRIIIALALSHLVFVGSLVAMGLDSDDRMIIGAVWSRLRGIF